MRTLDTQTLWRASQIEDSWVAGFGGKMQSRPFLNSVFLGRHREGGGRGRSFLLPKRPRNDERGNISFSETTANLSGG